MNTINYKTVELTKDELCEIQGGFLEIVLAGIAIGGAIYGAGYAMGQAYYHYSH